jgi:hypothetical protein
LKKVNAAPHLRKEIYWTRMEPTISSLVLVGVVLRANSVAMCTAINALVCVACLVCSQISLGSDVAFKEAAWQHLTALQQAAVHHSLTSV